MGLGQLVEVLVGEGDNCGVGLADYRGGTALNVDKFHLSKRIAGMEGGYFAFGFGTVFGMLLDADCALDYEVNGVVWITLSQNAGPFRKFLFIEMRSDNVELCFGQTTEHAVFGEEFIAKRTFRHTP